MAVEATTNGCPNCERMSLRLAVLEKQVADLQRQLANATKNSQTSSKPPSSDIVNPPKKRLKPGRRKKPKQGGQPGHPRYERSLFEPDRVNEFWEYYHESCPCCDGPLKDVGRAPQVIQQIEIQTIPIKVSEHQRILQRCEACDKEVCVPWPEDLRRAGLVGPRLTALVGYLKGACHMSVGRIKAYFRDVIGVSISRGQIAKLVSKVSDSLKDPFDELLALLPQEDHLNVDETGHKDCGKGMWTWCFRAYLFTVYKVSPSRGSDVLIEVLGKEFDGVLGCDYFSAYRKYMRLNDNVGLQFCIAHLIRDVKFLAQHPDASNRAYGARLLGLLQKLFGIIHRHDQYSSEETFRDALERVQSDLVWEATFKSPHTREATNLEERFFQHTESYFRFITTPGIKPTNNLAEQAIRFIAIHRRLTQGTRGEVGQRWLERIATAIATCEQQGRPLLEFLRDAVTSYLSGKPAPSLAPNTT